MGDIIVLAILGIVIFFAIKSLKKGSSCSGNCSTCMSGSEACHIDWQEVRKKVKEDNDK